MKRHRWFWVGGMTFSGLANLMHVGAQESDPSAFVYWVQPKDVLSRDVSEAQEERKKAARADLDLEASMREKGYFWVNGGWIKKGEPILPARSAGELKDSDRDGFDDFTEVKFHTDPFKAESTPASYFRAKGSNQVVFYGTNPTAHKK